MTKDEILSRLLSDISDEFDKDVGSFFYDVTKPTSGEFETAYARLEEILKNGFALTATGEYLDYKAAEQGITRKSGVASQVEVTITGAPGSVISVGDKVASDSLVFSSIENVEIGESGTADVTVICDTYCRQHSARRNKPFSRYALRDCFGHEQEICNGRF